MNGELDIALHLLAALAIGLLIGLERGWSGRKEDDGDRVAGIRTLGLIGLTGGLSVELSQQIGTWFIPVIFGAVTVMTLVSYLEEARENNDIGTTTSFAMIMTYLLSVWAAFGFYIPAFSVTAVVVALLGLKPLLHEGVSRIETREIYAGIKLLIISLVLLPLLPNQGYGPWDAVNPSWVWWMVVLICSISFVGYFAIKYMGNKNGILVTSFTGGLASSTAVTLSMAHLSRKYSKLTLFITGVMIASSVMMIRVAIEVAVVYWELMYVLWLPLTVMFLSLLAGGLWFWRRSDDPVETHSVEINNPFKLTTALKFGLLLAVIMFLAAAMEDGFGERGIYVLSFISGFADVNAITLSLSHRAKEGLDMGVASFGIMIAVSVKTIVKGCIFAWFAGFKQSLTMIGLLVLSSIAGLVTTFFII